MWPRNSNPAGPDFSLKSLSSAVLQQALDLRWSLRPGKVRGSGCPLKTAGGDNYLDNV